MNIETLSDLLVVELTRTHAVEQRLASELATLEDDVDVDALDDQGHTELRQTLTDAIAEHQAETETHAARVEAALEALNERPTGRQTPALDGLLEEKDLFNNVVLDDAIRPFYYVGTAQEIERLEITAYERLERMAAHLDVPSAVTEAIELNLAEEREALDRLVALAPADDMADLLDELAAAQASP